MKKKRTIRIEVEKEREVVIRHRESREAWCAACGAQVQFVTVAEAAHLAGLSELALSRQLAACPLHFDETADGRVLICLDSLRQQRGSLKRTAPTAVSGNAQE